MKKYIGCKVVEAEPCIRIIKRGRDGYTPITELVGVDSVIPIDADITHGYKVRYADGYESFSPQAAFESAYIECDNECNINPESLIAKEECSISSDAKLLGAKVGCFKAKLINGDEIFHCKVGLANEVNDEEMLEAVKHGALELIKRKCSFAVFTARNGLDSIPKKGN